MTGKEIASVAAGAVVAGGIITAIVLTQQAGFGPPRPMYVMPAQTNTTEQVIAFKKYRRIVIPHGKAKAQQDAFWQNYMNMQKEGGAYVPPPTQ